MLFFLFHLALALVAADDAGCDADGSCFLQAVPRAVTRGLVDSNNTRSPTRGIVYALNGDGYRVVELNAALACLSDQKIDLPIRIECYPDNSLCVQNIKYGANLNVTLVPDTDLKDKEQRKGNLHKAVAAWNSPFDWTLVMDTDTCVVSPHLDQMFDPLSDVDFVSTWECCALPQSEAIYGTGFEPQTGVFAVKRSADSKRDLMRAWWQEYFNNESHYTKFSSTDQQAMLKVLITQNWKSYPLPALFNFRDYTMPSSSSSEDAFGLGPVVVHGHGLKSTDDAAEQAVRNAQSFGDIIEKGANQIKN